MGILRRKPSIMLSGLLITSLSFVFYTAKASCASTPDSVPVSVHTAEGLVGRLIPERASEFVFEELSDTSNDVFELEMVKGKVVIRGNNGISMAVGLNWYLKEYCYNNVTLWGNNLNIPKELPKIEGVVRNTSWAQYRYFLNYCAYGYSLPWWDWKQWEKLIDYMALNGVNAPLVVTGQEATWQAVSRRLGLNDAEISQFLAGPPYLPFGWMGCLDGWGGPLPESWIVEHESLAKKILKRERQFGMKPVLQGFTGHVPAALKKKFPNAKMHTVEWVEWITYLLDPQDPLFQTIGDLFMEEQTKRFGTDHLYASDTFIEMVPPSGELDYLTHLSKAIYTGMSKSDSDAVWVFQTWPFRFKRDFWTQPRIQAYLKGVPDDKMLCLDLACEDLPLWPLTKSFYGKPWLWCNIQNYGNKVFLGGGLDGISSGVIEVRNNPDRGDLRGLGFVNEGLDYNPVVQDIMFEMAWREKSVNISDWVNRYAGYRYGHSNQYAQKAWSILLETVYAKAVGDFVPSIMTSYPALRSIEEKPLYNNVQLAEAWGNLLKASKDLEHLDTYQFDLVNVSRQVLSNYAGYLHIKMSKAYNSKNKNAFSVAAKDFLQIMMDIDELLKTREEFLLGKTLEDAKRWGTTPEEKSVFEWNARRMLTLWGTKELNDYARKEWSGLISGFYHPRWQKFIKQLDTDLVNGKSYDNDSFNKKLHQWMEAWSDSRESYPATPKGKSVDVAKKLWSKYSAAIRSVK